MGVWHHDLYWQLGVKTRRVWVFQSYVGWDENLMHVADGVVGYVSLRGCNTAMMFGPEKETLVTVHQYA